MEQLVAATVLRQSGERILVSALQQSGARSAPHAAHSRAESKLAGVLESRTLLRWTAHCHTDTVLAHVCPQHLSCISRQLCSTLGSAQLSAQLSAPLTMPFSSKQVTFRTHARTWMRFFLGTRLGPYHEMSPPIVSALLKLGRVSRSDHLFDIGCGDGRILLEAARHGAKATGIELDKRVAELARSNVEKSGVDPALVTVLEQDAKKTDLSQATLVTLYLSERGNAALLPTLQPWILASPPLVKNGTDASPAPAPLAASSGVAAATAAPAAPARRVATFLFPMPTWSPVTTELDQGSGIPLFLYDTTSVPSKARQQWQAQQTNAAAQTPKAS